MFEVIISIGQNVTFAIQSQNLHGDVNIFCYIKNALNVNKLIQKKFNLIRFYVKYFNFLKVIVKKKLSLQIRKTWKMENELEYFE